MIPLPSSNERSTIGNEESRHFNDLSRKAGTSRGNSIHRVHDPSWLARRTLRRQIDLFTSMEPNGNPLDQISISSIDGGPHPAGTNDSAIVSPTDLSEFFTVPWPIVSDNISHFQWLALKVRSDWLTHLSA